MLSIYKICDPDPYITAPSLLLIFTSSSFKVLPLSDNLQEVLEHAAQLDRENQRIKELTASLKQFKLNIPAPGSHSINNQTGKSCMCYFECVDKVLTLIHIYDECRYVVQVI